MITVDADISCVVAMPYFSVEKRDRDKSPSGKWMAQDVDVLEYEERVMAWH